MNPYADARLFVERAEDALAAWAATAAASAGAELAIARHHPKVPPSQRTIVVRPLRLALWPKLVELGDPVPLLGGGATRRAGSAGVPGRWLELSSAVTEGLMALLPQADPRRPGLASSTPRASLPAPLQRWYEAVGEPWASADAAHLPAWSYSPGAKARLHYLLQVIDPEGATPTGVGVLAALLVATHRARQLTVHLPDAALPELARSWVEALAASSAPDVGARIRAAAATVGEPGAQNLPLQPEELPDGDDFATMMRSLGEPLRPSLLVSLQLPLGAEVDFGIAVRPDLRTEPMSRGAP